MTTSDGPSRPDLSALRMDRSEPTPRRGWGWLVALVVLAALAAAAWWFLRAGALPPRVELATVQSVSVTESQTVLTATGYTYARSRAAVGSKIIGRVVELPYDEGDRVRRGATLAVLDSEDLEASRRQAEARLAEAEARLADAEREVSRRRALVDADVMAQAELDAAVTALDVAEAQVGTAQASLDSIVAQLGYTVIRAPIDGVVIQRNVEVGEMVAPGGFTTQQSTGAIVRLADPASLEIEADVNESYISRLQVGQPVTIRVDAVPGHDYHGELRQIVPTADRQRAVVEVKVTIDDRDERLVPDMSCTVSFLEEGTAREQLETEDEIVLPSSALVRDGANAYVMRFEDGRVERRLVELAQAEGDGEDGDGAAADSAMVEVASGVVPGDRVVRTGAEHLEDGQRVREQK
ncbi:MAG: efflux RND transporter periplasmic adaptor subunit [Acidobacteria bacterium]|nr:MAG: efflux RND transporter periplasmic adaptor subunit [Acidobacteriota bacterium]REK06256.1 MAG: efflux RND transporter periplasmic adaptor subunit [Acidobacteriota bacterium]